MNINRELEKIIAKHMLEECPTAEQKNALFFILQRSICGQTLRRC